MATKSAYGQQSKDKLARAYKNAVLYKKFNPPKRGKGKKTKGGGS